MISNTPTQNTSILFSKFLPILASTPINVYTNTERNLLIYKTPKAYLNNDQFCGFADSYRKYEYCILDDFSESLYEHLERGIKMPIIKTKKTVIYEKCIEGVKRLIIHVEECELVSEHENIQPQLEELTNMETTVPEPKITQKNLSLIPKQNERLRLGEYNPSNQDQIYVVRIIEKEPFRQINKSNNIVTEKNVNNRPFKEHTFYLYVTDEFGDQLRYTAFNQFKKNFYDNFYVGSYYLLIFKNLKKKELKPLYPPVSNLRYEIAISDSKTFKSIRILTIYRFTHALTQINLTGLCEAKNTDGTYINVVGCIAKVDKASFIFSEDQRKIISKKYIYLINRSGIPVAMSTMERQCIQITKEDIEQAYIFKYVKAKRYNDKYLCLTMTKDTIIIKDDSEYEILRVMEHVNEINLNQLNYPVVTGDSEDIILQKLRLCFNISLNNQCNIKPDQAFYIIVRITSWGSFNCKVIQLK